MLRKLGQKFSGTKDFGYIFCFKKSWTHKKILGFKNFVPKNLLFVCFGSEKVLVKKDYPEIATYMQLMQP